MSIGKSGLSPANGLAAASGTKTAAANGHGQVGWNRGNATLPSLRLQGQT
ncbi:hypothetical protein [Cohnella fermenti]|nr:hypothetical protein [Cohnella fermenti]